MPTIIMKEKKRIISFKEKFFYPDYLATIEAI